MSQARVEPRTNADERHAVRVLLGDGEWSLWNDRQIAVHRKISNTLVSSMRGPTCQPLTDGARKFKRGGRTRTMRTGDNAETGQDAALAGKGLSAVVLQWAFAPVHLVREQSLARRGSRR